MKLYYRDMPCQYSADAVQKIFEKFGPVESISVVKHTYKSRNTGYGFVRFLSKEDGAKAVETLNGRTLLH